MCPTTPAAVSRPPRRPPRTWGAISARGSPSSPRQLHTDHGETNLARRLRRGSRRRRGGAGVCCHSGWSHCRYVVFGKRRRAAACSQVRVCASSGSPGCSLRAPGDPRCSVPLFPAAQDVRDGFLSLPAGTTYSFRRPSLNHLRPSCWPFQLPQTCDFASSHPLPGRATIMEMPVPRYARPRQIQQPNSSFALRTSRRPSPLPLDVRVLARNPFSRAYTRTGAHSRVLLLGLRTLHCGMVPSYVRLAASPSWLSWSHRHRHHHLYLVSPSASASPALWRCVSSGGTLYSGHERDSPDSNSWPEQPGQFDRTGGLMFPSVWPRPGSRTSARTQSFSSPTICDGTSARPNPNCIHEPICSQRRHVLIISPGSCPFSPAPPVR